MAEAMSGVEQYEAWLRKYVSLAEAGRKLASQLADAARRGASRMNEQRFSSHAQRLYNEEVYWTLQIAGIAQLGAAQRTQTQVAPPPPAPKSKPQKAAPRAKPATPRRAARGKA
jgi:hypothetical protein